MRDEEVLAALDDLVIAFGSSDEDAYFGLLHPEATFVLPGSPWLQSRAAYRAAWQQWVAEDGFTVLSCDSTDRHVQWVRDTAVITHAVTTTVRTHAGGETTRERETVVLAQDGSRWLVVHEHLSPHLTLQEELR